MRGYSSDAIVLVNVNSVRKERERVPVLGRRFGKLTPYEKVYGRYKKDNKTVIMYKCHCECGNDVVVSKPKLLHTNIQDCGCSKKKKLEKHTVKAKCTHKEKKPVCEVKEKSHIKHKGRLYNIWQGIKRRCKGSGGQNTVRYYAGRGIKYQPSWEKFENFYNDMIEGYADNLQLDRINSDGDYTKENCRWVTAKENCRNRRDNSFVTAGGETHVQAWWKEKYGVSNTDSLRRCLRRDYGDDWEIKLGHRQNWLDTPRYHV